MSGKIKFGNVVLCEYLAQGIGNKHTLINVYSGDIIVAEFPSKLLLSLYLEYIANSPEEFVVRAEVRVNKRPYARFRFDVEAGAAGRLGVMAVPNMALETEGDVTFDVVILIEGERSQTILRKKIFHGVIA